jgi:anthranilate phosphoribosyltransferase
MRYLKNKVFTINLERQRARFNNSKLMFLFAYYFLPLYPKMPNMRQATERDKVERD